MGLLTRKEEHLNRIAYLPKTITSIVDRVAQQYKFHNVSASLLELERAMRSLEDLKRSIIFVKNIPEEK